MFFETYDKLKKYAVLHPEQLESLTKEELDNMEFAVHEADDQNSPKTKGC